MSFCIKDLLLLLLCSETLSPTIKPVSNDIKIVYI